VSDAERAMKRLRENIDQVDSVLVKLLNQRAQWALDIGEVKKGAGLPIYQPDREKAVLARVQQLNRGPLGQAAVQRLFERIIDESRRLERIGGEGEGPGEQTASAGGGAEEGPRVAHGPNGGGREGTS
jgi:chorismate mutase